MLFNSLTFIAFAILVIFIYFILAHKFRWAFLLASSYFFYMCAQPGYALLIGFTTVVSYSIGLYLNSDNKARNKLFLRISVILNLGVLFFFKYFNFLNESIKEIIESITGLSYSFEGFDIALPIGISFYTFQTLSYNLDVYYKIKKPEKHLGIFALFVSFFPQLVAGPIERSTTLLPQFRKVTKFSWDRFNRGMQYVIWGLFKKVVIADRLSQFVNEAYNHHETYQGSSIFVLATLLFAFQLYCDFSAYSDIAKGLAKILGYNLMENFNHPFSAKNITDFWRKWHISLSTWLRDYLYTPLAFKYKRWGKKGILLSIFITFLLCGAWHGTKVNYLIFGLIQAIALMYELATIEKRKIIRTKMNTKLYDLISVALTFMFVVFSFIFFRADSVIQAFDIVGEIFSFKAQFSEISELLANSKIRFLILSIILLAFIFFDKKMFKIVKGEKITSLFKQRLIFACLTAFIIIFGFYDIVEFFYFQF
jgi:alginate O-acetyltransferase complex protein AlgI